MSAVVYIENQRYLQLCSYYEDTERFEWEGSLKCEQPIGTFEAIYMYFGNGMHAELYTESI